uniref:Uncharacterized protein n=1 Tax=Arundo donax TaxID=35708 RepID=A0A0A9ADC5_ARUDO
MMSQLMYLHAWHHYRLDLAPCSHFPERNLERHHLQCVQFLCLICDLPLQMHSRNADKQQPLIMHEHLLGNLTLPQACDQQQLCQVQEQIHLHRKRRFCNHSTYDLLIWSSPRKQLPHLTAC